MRRRHFADPEPRSDGFVAGGLIVVVLLTVVAFASSNVLESMQQPGARAYTLATMPRAGVEEVPLVSPEETGAVSAPMSVPEVEAKACNVARCAAAYRSFNVDDCTFQPFEGPRRICGY